MPRASFHLEDLEVRRLLATDYPTAAEQYLIELINRARANPTAEAQRLGIDLNEGLQPNTISATAKQPLAINPFLTDAAGNHARWMIDFDTFSHFEGSVGPQQRMTAAGYSFTGSYTYGENIGWSGSYPGTPSLGPTTSQIHDDLFVDSTTTNRGHRVNIMWDAFKEIGPGVVTGVFSSGGTNWNAVMLATDFAASTGNAGGDSFLTGVAYADLVTHDSFYSIGEGLSGATITAVRASDNATFTTTTWSSGGYSLRLQPGTYTVTATGGGITTPIVYSSVVIGTENVKRDFVPQADTTKPTASNGAFVVDTAPLRVTVKFSESVAASLSSADLQVRKIGSTTNLPVTFAGFDGATNTATFTINSVPADGNYRATLLAPGITDLAGNALAADYSIDFFILTADASRDRFVDTVDFNMMASHLGDSGSTFVNGDFNYDGDVNVSDASVLAAHFGQRMSAATGASAAPAAVPTTTRRLSSSFGETSIGLRDSESDDPSEQTTALL